MSTLFSPPDMELAHAKFDAACGHGALAAALGIPVCVTMMYFDLGGWVNIPMMKTAIVAATGRIPARVSAIPAKGIGVAMIQFEGPWSAPGVPRAAGCRYRHWVACWDGMIWDANLEYWATRESWEEFVLELYPARATAHTISGVYLIDDGKGQEVEA